MEGLGASLESMGAGSMHALMDSLWHLIRALFLFHGVVPTLYKNQIKPSFFFFSGFFLRSELKADGYDLNSYLYVCILFPGKGNSPLTCCLFLR